MRILLIHSDYLNYNVKNKTPVAEDIEEAKKEGSFDDSLVVFTAVEKDDENNPEGIVKNLVNEVKKTNDQVKAENIVVYPYAHLSSSLGSPKVAVQILKDAEEALLAEGFNVKRVPFGWYKAFEISCKGHPLSELSRTITADDAEEALLCYPDALLMNFEIPNEAILTAAHFAAKKGIPIVIDAGPAKPDFPFEKLPVLEIFSPNESETQTYTGINPSNADNALRAAVVLQKIVKSHYYVIKLGDKGALVYDGKYYSIASSYEVKAVDTTAAGDSFTAALTLEYLRSGNIMHSMRYANAVGAYVVSKRGASSSIPKEKQLFAFMENQGIKI